MIFAGGAGLPPLRACGMMGRSVTGRAERRAAGMRARASAIFLALLFMPPAAFAQGRGHGAAGPSAGMKRAAYVAAAQARAGRHAGRRFDQIDSGHTGVIRRDAYIKYYEARSARLAGKRFDRIDTDRNGVLESSELAAWRADHRRAPRARPAARAAH
jgi:hypothetical protein